VLAQKDFVIGIDIGGTKVAAGLVDGSARIRHQARSPMSPDGDAAAGLAAVISAINMVSAGSRDREQHPLRGIGISSPGPLNPETGVVINPPNLPCWRNFPLVTEIAQIYGVPVKLDNDANCGALAEARWGAGRGYSSVFYVTIGTGFGTGIVLNGNLYHGRTGAAGEGGHLSIDYRGPECRCGKRGCIEALVSGPAIAQRTRIRLMRLQGVRSTILDLANGSIETITSDMIDRANMSGDAVAREILLETVEFLSMWLGNIVDLLEPEVIIIGGGVANMLSPFFDEIRDRLPSYCLNKRCHEIPLLRAHYGNDSGILGAASIVSVENQNGGTPSPFLLQ
jgi:glucokinase